MELAAISAQFENYENKWVAIDESQEKIVGVGVDGLKQLKTLNAVAIRM
jgi:hypothetical protein